MGAGLMRGVLAARAAELARDRVPFVQATVVRAVHPTSAHAGDTALVHGDGRIEGFVGGSCVETSVRVQALEVLVSGQPRLLRVEAGATGTTAEEGVVTMRNPCVSGGTVEIFLEPQRPPARLVVVGTTPVAQALVAMAGPLGLAVETRDFERATDGTGYGSDLGAMGLDDVAAVVVASHGHGEEPALEAALRAGVPYVGLVASRMRAAAVLGSLAAEGTNRVHSPAGLDLGGRTAPEIALSILAELVSETATAAAATREPAHPTGSVGAAGSAGSAGSGEALASAGTRVSATAVDPVCGMTVPTTGDTAQAVADGVTRWFCCEHCRRAFLADPARYAPG